MVMAWNGDYPETYRIIPRSQWNVREHVRPPSPPIAVEGMDNDTRCTICDTAGPGNWRHCGVCGRTRMCFYCSYDHNCDANTEPEPEGNSNEIHTPEMERARYRFRQNLQNAMQQQMGQTIADSGDTPPTTDPEAGVRWFCGPSFLRGSTTQEVYLRSTRLTGEREGLLIDPGAFDNLVGSRWVERMRELGHVGTTRTIRPIGVEGVGASAQQARESINIEGHVRAVDGSTHSASYEAPVIEGSEIPALWGHRSLARNRAVLDTVNRRLHLCGEGEIRFVPPPGTLSVNLELSSSGHLLLPFTESATTSARNRGRLNLNFSSAPLQDMEGDDEALAQTGGATSQ